MALLFDHDSDDAADTPAPVDPVDPVDPIDPVDPVDPPAPQPEPVLHTVTGTAGNDQLEISATLMASQGMGAQDTLEVMTGAGDDRINIGTISNDDQSYVHASLVVDAGDGHDLIWGDDLHEHAATLRGGAGNDTITASGDRVDGGDGDDFLIERNEYLNDQSLSSTLSGGRGADTFSMQGTFGGARPEAPPLIITDFNAAQGDRLHVLTHLDSAISIDNNVRSGRAILDHVDTATTAEGTRLTLAYRSIDGGPDLMREVLLQGVTDLPADAWMPATTIPGNVHTTAAIQVSGSATISGADDLFVVGTDQADTVQIDSAAPHDIAGNLGAGADTLSVVFPGPPHLLPGSGITTSVDLGAGDDVVHLSTANDPHTGAVIHGGSGNDLIETGIGGRYSGGEGDDTLSSTAAPGFSLYLNDADANATLDAGEGADQVALGAGHHAVLGDDHDADHARLAVDEAALDMDRIGTIDQIGAEDAIVLSLPAGATGAVSYSFDGDRVTVLYEGAPVAKLGFQPGQAPVNEAGLTGILTVTR